MVEKDRIARLTWTALSGYTHPVGNEAVKQLQAYFAGRLERFDLPLVSGKSTFQKSFIDSLCDIPFGETRTYGDMARALNVSSQAIGQACGANSVPIIVPCHRVLGQSGLGGYSGEGGVETKVALLKHENAGSLLI